MPLALRVAKVSPSFIGRAVSLASAQPESMIIQLAIESGKIGLGAVVMTSTVNASTFSIRSTGANQDAVSALSEEARS